MKRFTLIELLVVIVIIAILISMLMPSLARAKKKAKMVTHMGNMKQMTLGMLSYAKDNKYTMPQFEQTGTINSSFNRETNNFMLNAGGYVRYDWRDTLTKYGIMSSTENVIVNLPAFNDDGNTSSSQLPMSWIYQVGNNYASYDEVVSPNKFNLASGSNVILSDLLRQSSGGDYYGTFGKGGTRYTYESNGWSSRGFYYGFKPEGGYATYYDGSVSWTDKGDMDYWTRSNGWHHWYVPNQ